MALTSISGIEIARILKDNITLVHLNLSKNLLDDDFAKEFAISLKIN